MSNFLVNESVGGRGWWLEVGVVVGLVWPVAKEGPHTICLCTLCTKPATCMAAAHRVEYLFSVLYVAVYNVRPEGIT